jgi:hypothetical protein
MHRSDSGVFSSRATNATTLQHISIPPDWAVWKDVDPVTSVPFIRPEAAVTALFIPRAAFDNGSKLFGDLCGGAPISEHYRTVLSVLMYCANKLPMTRYQGSPELVVAVEQMLTDDNEVGGYLFTFATQAAPRPIPHRGGGGLRRRSSDNEEEDDEKKDGDGDGDNEEDENGKKKKKRSQPRTLFEAISNLIWDLEEQRDRIQDRVREIPQSQLPYYRRISRASWCMALGAVTSAPVNPDDFVFYSQDRRPFSNAFNPCDPSVILTLRSALQSAAISGIRASQSTLSNYKVIGHAGSCLYQRPHPELVSRLQVEQFINDRIFSTFVPETPRPAPPTSQPWQQHLVTQRLEAKGLSDHEIAARLVQFESHYFQPPAGHRPSLVQ